MIRRWTHTWCGPLWRSDRVGAVIMGEKSMSLFRKECVFELIARFKQPGQHLMHAWSMLSLGDKCCCRTGVQRVDNGAMLNVQVRVWRVLSLKERIISATKGLIII